jgi:hypothetical protein
VRRAFSILSASWLVLLLAEPRVLHVCAVHADGMGSVASTHDDGGHSATMPSHGKAPSHEHSSKCTCLGASSYSSSVVIPSVEVSAFAEAPVAIARELPATADAPLPSPSPFFLPYPHGPPVTIAS